MTPLDDEPLPICRSAARKSRITSSFFDAKERLDEALSGQTDYLCTPSSSKDSGVLSEQNQERILITLPESPLKSALGVEISPIYDPSNDLRLQSVEVRQIDEKGRVAADGRIKVGDCIVEINGRPVYQMSISRARNYLHELQMVPSPTLTIVRPVNTSKDAKTLEPESHSIITEQMKRPIFSALQQANTTAVGTTTRVEIKKKSHGFGFNITGRETAKGLRLFYVGTVKPDGPAFGILRTGDRLLEVNGEPTEGLKQSSIVSKLKALSIGDQVSLLISRVDKENNCVYNESVAVTVNEGQTLESKNNVSNTQNFCSFNNSKYGEVLSLDIPLNGSSGPGISLKALSKKKNGCTQDCGIFIKQILHGGAAFKDGQLRVNDQLIAIEDIDLRMLRNNSEASEAIMKCFRTIGPSTRSIHMSVARNALPDVEDLNSSNDDIQSFTKQGRQVVSTDGCNFNNLDHKNTSLTIGEQHWALEDEWGHQDVDTFNRENPSRRSVSEKRHMGSSKDTSHTLLLQRIKHFRCSSVSPKRRSRSLENTASNVSHRSLPLQNSLQVYKEAGQDNLVKLRHSAAISGEASVGSTSLDLKECWKRDHILSERLRTHESKHKEVQQDPATSLLCKKYTNPSDIVKSSLQVEEAQNKKETKNSQSNCSNEFTLSRMKFCKSTPSTAKTNEDVSVHASPAKAPRAVPIPNMQPRSNSSFAPSASKPQRSPTNMQVHNHQAAQLSQQDRSRLTVTKGQTFGACHTNNLGTNLNGMSRRIPVVFPTSRTVYVASPKKVSVNPPHNKALNNRKPQVIFGTEPLIRSYKVFSQSIRRNPLPPPISFHPTKQLDFRPEFPKPNTAPHEIRNHISTRQSSETVAGHEQQELQKITSGGHTHSTSQPFLRKNDEIPVSHSILKQSNQVKQTETKLRRSERPSISHSRPNTYC